MTDKTEDDTVRVNVPDTTAEVLRDAYESVEERNRQQRKTWLALQDARMVVVHAACDLVDTDTIEAWDKLLAAVDALRKVGA